MRISNWSLGIACIFSVALIWSGSSVLVQAIFTRVNFSRPFFLTWVANSLFMLTFPVRLIFVVIRRRLRGDSSTESIFGSSVEFRRTLRAGVLVAPIWFAANCTYNISMSLTSITSTTVISSSSAGFTLLLSVVWLGERLTMLKVLGVFLCMLGNVLIVFSDDSSSASNVTAAAAPGGSGGGDGGPSPSFHGDMVCLLSAGLYAWYTALIRRLAPRDLSLFFGCLGLTTFLLFGPVVALLHGTRVEDLSTLTPAILGLLVCKGVFDNVISDYLWAAAVLLTSPSVATIGMSLTVPLAMLSDMLMPKDWLVDPMKPTPFSLLSAAAVVSGFVAINVASAADDQCRAGMRERLLGPRGCGEGHNSSSGAIGAGRGEGEGLPVAEEIAHEDVAPAMAAGPLPDQ